MDEEDLADAEEAKRLQTSDSFANLGLTEGEVSQRGVFMDVFKTGGDTMGVKLLRKMGWRDGQGVGPKVRRIARLDDTDDNGGDGQDIHLFAPENSQMISFVRKNDHKGLGFSGETSLVGTTDGESQGKLLDEPSSNGISSSLSKSKKKASTKPTGFGVGILNDNGSDDDDPYQIGPQISYSRIIGGEKEKKKKKSKKTADSKPSIGASNPLVRTKPIFISKKAAHSKFSSGFRRCHDGRLPLDGFVLPENQDANSSDMIFHHKYSAPNIPKDWKSTKIPESTNPHSSSDKSSYQSPADVARASILNPSTRASLLGETTLPGKSVFDYLSPTARSRIALATNNTNLPAALNEAPPPGHEFPPSSKGSDLKSLVPGLDSLVAATALGRGIGGWMPYAEDPGKRARYRSFLELRAGLRPEEQLPDRAEDMSTADWVTEMKEFAHAAQIFKPMTGLMASRFTSSRSGGAVQSQDTNTSFGVAEVGNDEKNEESLLSRPVERPKDPAAEAAQLGMFGPLTRSTVTFFPTRLLCKRFNAKPPDHVQMDPGGRAPDQDVPTGVPFGVNPETSTAAAPSSRFQSGGYQTSPDVRSASSSVSMATQKRLEIVGKNEMDEMMREGGYSLSTVRGEGNGAATRTIIDKERNEALEGERPGEAVFKAIFGSDSEGEE